MKKIICGFELECPPEKNPFGMDYDWHEVIGETERAYLVKHSYIHRTFGTKAVFKWVRKIDCKIDENGDVFVPVWIVTAEPFRVPVSQ